MAVESLIYTPALYGRLLIDRKAKFLLTLTNSNHIESESGLYHFDFDDRPGFNDFLWSLPFCMTSGISFEAFQAEITLPLAFYQVLGHGMNVALQLRCDPLFENPDPPR